MKKYEITEESKQPQNIEEGKNFKKADFGSFRNLNEFIIKNADRNIKVEGKVFLHDVLNLTGAEISINNAPAGFKMPFKHIHKENEEIFIILSGKGQIEVDDKLIDIQEGSVIRIDPNGVRSFENTSDEDLIFMVVQAKANSLGQFTLTDGARV